MQLHPSSKAFRVLAIGAFLTLTPSLHAQQAMDEIVEATIADVHRALDQGALTCRQLVQRYLDRIAAYDQQGPALNAIQHVNARALLEADSLDAVQRAGSPRGPLHCVPVLLKDQVETRDMPTTYGSAIFRDFVPARDATIVERLEAAGAIMLAKTTMGEFASRYVGSMAGIIRNAYDPTRNPSGSSGGTGSGVAANFGLVGIGEDTGGSIRGPAAVSSLVGLRPTVGLVSVFGMMPASPTQDVLGPMTRTVTDAARVLDVIAGYDARDPRTARAEERRPPSYAAALREGALRGARIGVLRSRRDTSAELAANRRDTTLGADSLRVLDSLVRYRAGEYAKVAPVFAQALADLAARGAVIVDSLTIPMPRGRGEGNDFETESATDAYLAQHPNAPVRTLRDIVLSGTVTPWRAVQLLGYLNRTTDDEGFRALLQRRAATRDSVLQLMATHRLDALVYATFDAPPQPIGAEVLTSRRPVDGYGLGDNRGISPSIGYPALTVPAGFSPDGLPVGLELLGRPFEEARLLALAFDYEQATHRRRPPSTTPPLVTR